jgi:hypothetical protein
VFPFAVIVPGDAVRVQLPEGKPLRSTLPVGDEHVGCVTVPVTGADGVLGCVFIEADEVEPEVHPSELVTVNV